MTPVTNKSFQKEGHRVQKVIKLGLKTFSRRILSAYSTTFESLEKIMFFTVKLKTNLRLLNVRIAYWEIKILYTTIFRKI